MTKRTFHLIQDKETGKFAVLRGMKYELDRWADNPSHATGFYSERSARTTLQMIENNRTMQIAKVKF